MFTGLTLQLARPRVLQQVLEQVVEPPDLVPYENQRLQRTGLLGARADPKTALQDGQLQPGSVERVADLVGEARGERTDRRHPLGLEVFPVGVEL
jgi:hypothetical protein